MLKIASELRAETLQTLMAARLTLGRLQEVPLPDAEREELIRLDRDLSTEIERIQRVIRRFEQLGYDVGWE